MSQLDTYYRALTDYRKVTLEKKDCARQRKNIQQADPDNDLIEVVRTKCIINNDWIDAIEKGLVPLEKALKEERQFITTNGEVVPIEKVKHVSRDSVEHLAKHSNLLTHVTEGEDLIPDQIYTVERLSDYSVYENRFLYMLLCYLRDFIAYRYDKILDLTNTYSGKLAIKKTVLSQSGRMTIELNLDEKHRGDEYLKAHNPAKEQLDRIDLLLKSVTLFLSTPLMKLVSQAPLLKPPIVETNVLKMDINFKGAMELYYFIAAYEGDGFTIEQEVKRITPFDENVGDEFAEVVALSSFLTYRYGMGISDDLKANYEQEERERAQREEQAHIEQLERLKKRIKESGESPEEYMLLLEQRIRELGKECEEISAAQSEIAGLNGEIKSLNDKNEQLIGTIENLHKQVQDIQADYSSQLSELARQHQEEIERLNGEHEQALHQAEENFESQRQSLNDEIDLLNQKITDERNACEQEKSQLKIDKNNAVQKMQETEQKYSQLERQKLLLNAQLNALKQERGLIKSEDEYTSEESFEEIEKQYEVFKQFFNERWKATKKRIRKEVLKPSKQSGNRDGQAH
jgi:hypothetical protein